VLRHLILLLAAMHWAFAVDAHAAVATEYEIKAAFIYNFSLYVQWPAADAEKPFTVCVIGKDPFGDVLDEAMSGKRVTGRPVTVRRFSRLDEVLGCDMLFVASSEAGNLERIFKALHNVPVLTIGETKQFAERGGMIELTTEGNRVRFEINVNAIDRARLKASSQLLRLAKIVSDSQPTR